MIHPPVNNCYEFGDKCSVSDKMCGSGFICGTCDVAKKYYETELLDNIDYYYDYIVPTVEKVSSNGTMYLMSRSYIVAKFNNIEIAKRFIGARYTENTYTKEQMKTDELKKRYPYWYALKILLSLDGPVRYIGERNKVLVVEYRNCVYVVAHVSEIDDV